MIPRNIHTFVGMVVVLTTLLSSCVPQSNAAAPLPSMAAVTATHTPAPTRTPTPTDTPVATYTPPPTDTPAPARTQMPAPTAIPLFSITLNPEESY